MLRSLLVAAVSAMAVALGCATSARADPSVAATCETIAHIVDALPEDLWASTVLLMTRPTIVRTEMSEAVMATIFCKKAPQVVCMEAANSGKLAGVVVSLSGRIARAGARYVVLDPCASTRSVE